MEPILEQGPEFDNLEQLKQLCRLYSIHNDTNQTHRVMKLFPALVTSMALLLVGLPIFSALEHIPQNTNALDSHIGLIMQPPLLLLLMSSVKNSKSNLSTIHAIFSVIFNVISALKFLRLFNSFSQ